jgi:glycosyltransferase involved in cell wall biosynthesis
MPIYNGIEFINESVTSIMHQTYANWELIIGINGHPSNSEVFQTAKYYETLDNRIKVYDLPTKGKPNSLNEMLKYCKYDYIALLDVDDIWHPYKLQMQVPFLSKFDIIGSRCVYFGDIVGTIPDIPVNDISNYDFSKLNPIVNSSCIVKKNICYWNEKMQMLEEYDMWIRLRKMNKKFYNCPHVLVKHRIHKTSAFNSRDTPEYKNRLIKHYFGPFA